MNFKNQIQAALLSMALLALPSISTASTGADNILGEQFCNIDGTPNSGWGFSKEGRAYYFAPNIGAPDPFTYHQVAFLRHPDRFSINQYEKETHKFIQQVATFTYHHDTQSIVSGAFVLSVSACK